MFETLKRFSKFLRYGLEGAVAVIVIVTLCADMNNEIGLSIFFLGALFIGLVEVLARAVVWIISGHFEASSKTNISPENLQKMREYYSCYRIKNFLRKPSKKYVKFIDRLSFLLCIPVAIWGFSFARAEYVYHSAVNIDESEGIKKMAEKMLPTGGNKQKPTWWQWATLDQEGVIISYEAEALRQKAGQSLLSTLQWEKALKDGADPAGDWVHKESFGVKRKKPSDFNSKTCIIPNMTKRIFSGVVGSIIFYAASLLAVFAFSRLVLLSIPFIKRHFRWIKSGLCSQ